MISNVSMMDAIQVHWEHENGSKEPFNSISPKMIFPTDRAPALASTSSGICLYNLPDVWCMFAVSNAMYHFPIEQFYLTEERQSKRIIILILWQLKLVTCYKRSENRSTNKNFDCFFFVAFLNSSFGTIITK